MKTPLRRADVHQLRHAIEGLAAGPRDPTQRVCLVVDADRTLAPQDTGRIAGRRLGVDDAIRATFEAHGYCEAAFSKVADLWGEIPTERYFEAVLAATAEVIVHPAWQTILESVRSCAPAVVVTAGIPQVWRRVLDALGHADLPVVGGCHRELDAYVVCPETKRDLVSMLRASGWRVVAAGDSPIDVEMLACADHALFVPDHKGSPGLRAQLHRISGVRHLAVDSRSFPEIPTCTAVEVVQMIRRGGSWDAA